MTPLQEASFERLTDEARHAWLHFANVPLAPRLALALLRQFHFNPRAVLDAADVELEEVTGFQSRHLVRLRDTQYAPTSRQQQWLEREDVTLLPFNAPNYPASLTELPDPPPLLFVRGTLDEADRFGVGVVGSRRATPYGRATAEKFSRELAARGLTVISGGAMGIDTAAHRGALAGGGRTLALLGCGLDVDYPRENRVLFEAIVQCGALISESPFGAQPESWRFPARNRLISGLSQGTLVVEAPRQSGALITARYALEHGKTVLAVPGNIDRPSSEGCNDLLKEGAVMVTEVDDVLHGLGMVALPARRDHQQSLPLEGSAASETDTPSPAPTRATAIARLPETQRRLLEHLSLLPRTLDFIAQAAEIPVSQAGMELTLLELNGHVRRLPGNAYIRVL